MHHRYAPRGHFRPWAKLSFPEATLAFRFAYPTLLCANNKHAFLHDVRTGALVQTIDFDVEWLQELEDEDDGICYVDVNERYAFVCEPRALHVFARDGNAEVLRIPSDALMSKVVEVDNIAGLGDPFVAVLPLSLWGDKYHCSDFLAGALPPPSPFSHRFYYPFTCSVQQSDDDSFFSIVHVSRDGHDLVISTTGKRVVFIQDFERICRGETSLLDVGRVLLLLRGYDVYHIASEHGRVCVATVRVFPCTFSCCTHSCLTPFSFFCPSLFFCSILGFSS